MVVSEEGDIQLWDIETALFRNLKEPLTKDIPEAASVCFVHGGLALLVGGYSRALIIDTDSMKKLLTLWLLAEAGTPLVMPQLEGPEAHQMVDIFGVSQTSCHISEIDAQCSNLPAELL